jgi:hypothetical protein
LSWEKEKRFRKKRTSRKRGEKDRKIKINRIERGTGGGRDRKTDRMRVERESHELKLANDFPESLMGPQSRCKMCINSTLFRPPEFFRRNSLSASSAGNY